MRAGFFLLAALVACNPLPALAQQIGVAAAVNQSAVGTPPSQKPRTMVLGAGVIHNEKIDTNGIGLLQILLADGTSFTVGPNSSMSIDSFVYDPGANTAKVVATFAKGTFRFIGGRTSKTPGGATINTPVGTVGIRGGIGDFDFSGRGGTPPHIDMIFGNSITLDRGGRQVGRLFTPGYSIALGAGGAAGVIKTPPGWTQALQRLLSGADRPQRRGGGGSGGSKTAAQIANAMSSSPPAGNSAPPAGLPVPTGRGAAQLATNLLPPLPPSVLPGGVGQPGGIGFATWGEINNSSLAGVAANYQGTYGMTVNATNLPPEVASQFTALNGNFSLDYYFGAQNGQGQIKFYDPAGNLLWDPLLQPASAGQGQPATFHAGVNQNYQSGNYAVSSSFNIDGGFQNTSQGVGHGVAGTIGIGASVNDGTQTTGISASGGFSGTLTTPPN